jgi:23S rRNA pseudouridine1911/1915/1917 synthase
MELKIIYEDDNVLVADKPAGIVVFQENPPAIESPASKEKTLIDCLIEIKPELKLTGFPPRYGIVHRLDKDTSGVLLVAKNNESLSFLQKEFKERKANKKYFALVTGNIKENQGKIRTLIGRSPKDRRKQKTYFPEENPKVKREAETYYKVLERFKGFTFLEIEPKTGRKHQIRCHLSSLGHPIAGDKLYGFKNQALPKGLNRQFLHASYIKINLPTKENRKFESKLPEDLNKIIKDLKENEK